MLPEIDIKRQRELPCMSKYLTILVGILGGKVRICSKSSSADDNCHN